MKYQELANKIMENIEDGIYREQEKLPTENELMEQYNVSRYCLRKAVDILVKYGIVYAVQGSGMYIRKSKREGCLSLRNTRGITAEIWNKKIETQVAHLEVMQADKEIADRMKCKLGTEIYYLIRIRKIDGEPFAVEYTYYNKEIVPNIDKKIASQSLFGYVKDVLGLNIGFADKILSCDKLSQETAEYLLLEPGDPVIIIEDDVYLTNGRMFNASRVYYHYKKIKFFDLAEVNN